MFTVAFVLVFVALLIEFLRQRRSRFRLFKRLGIPGPEPSFLWGHFRELRENHALWQERWSAEYGQTYGVFWGDKPFLITSDLDIAKQVLIAQFSNFVDRSPQFALESAHPVAQHMVAVQRGQGWKRSRMILTPAFSTGKMKNMVPLIEKCVDDFEKNLVKNAAGEEFDVYPRLKQFTSDNMARIIFGIETDVQKDSGSSSKLLQAALQYVETNLAGVVDLILNSFSSLGIVFNSVMRFLLSARIIPAGINDLVDEMNKIVRARRSAPPRNDLMQSLLDRQQISSDETSLAASDSAEDKESVSTKTKAYAKLTDEEVTASAIIMFGAGYETTSTALAFILNRLGLHRDVQERLRQEITDAMADRPLTYEIAMNLPYLDAVIREALRLHPPVSNFVTRMALHDTEINGLEIPAGLSILFPTKQIHLDPKTWENPTTFDPDRFLGNDYNRHAYQAFGDGPRNCMGMRFAYLVMKVLLCRILQRFEIIATESPRVRCVSVFTQPVQLNISVKEIRA